MLDKIEGFALNQELDIGGVTELAEADLSPKNSNKKEATALRTPTAILN